MLSIPNGDFTIDAFRILLRDHDDSVNRQVQVDCAGNVFFAQKVGSPYNPDVKFMLEIWIQGNGYSGVKASQDEAYVRNEFDLISSAWDQGRVGMIDF